MRSRPIEDVRPAGQHWCPQRADLRWTGRENLMARIQVSHWLHSVLLTNDLASLSSCHLPSLHAFLHHLSAISLPSSVLTPQNSSPSSAPCPRRPPDLQGGAALTLLRLGVGVPARRPVRLLDGRAGALGLSVRPLCSPLEVFRSPPSVPPPSAVSSLSGRHRQGGNRQGGNLFLF